MVIKKAAMALPPRQTLTTDSAARTLHHRQMDVLSYMTHTPFHAGPLASP